MKERREDLGFLLSTGTSAMRCMEAREMRRGGGVLSEFLLTSGCGLSTSPPSDFLRNFGRFDDSLSERGFFTASTSSVTELVATSFCLAAHCINRTRSSCLSS